MTKDGRIDKIVVLSGGNGYCPNDSSIGGGQDGGIDDNGVVGIVTGIYVDTPGIGYTSGDTILIPLPDGSGGDTGTGDPVPGDDTPGIIIEPVVTPGNGSIIDVVFPFIPTEFDSIPDIIINTKNGRGANLIPILEYVPRERTDTSGVKRSGLVVSLALLIVYDRRRSTKTSQRIRQPRKGILRCVVLDLILNLDLKLWVMT